MGSVKPLSPEQIGALKKLIMALTATRKVCDRTRQQYEKTARRYFDRPEEALLTSSKGTYYARKAALIFVAAHRFLTALEINDQFNALKSARVLKLFLLTQMDRRHSLPAASALLRPSPRWAKEKACAGCHWTGVSKWLQPRPPLHPKNGCC